MGHGEGNSCNGGGQEVDMAGHRAAVNAPSFVSCMDGLLVCYVNWPVQFQRTTFTLYAQIVADRNSEPKGEGGSVTTQRTFTVNGARNRDRRVEYKCLQPIPREILRPRYAQYREVCRGRDPGIKKNQWRKWVATWKGRRKRGESEGKQALLL